MKNYERVYGYSKEKGLGALNGVKEIQILKTNNYYKVFVYGELIKTLAVKESFIEYLKTIKLAEESLIDEDRRRLEGFFKSIKTLYFTDFEESSIWFNQADRFVEVEGSQLSDAKDLKDFSFLLNLINRVSDELEGNNISFVEKEKGIGVNYTVDGEEKSIEIGKIYFCNGVNSLFDIIEEKFVPTLHNLNEIKSHFERLDSYSPSDKMEFKFFKFIDSMVQIRSAVKEDEIYQKLLSNYEPLTDMNGLNYY